MGLNTIIEDTKEYYGKVLKKSTDLKTNACCTSVKYPKHILNILKEIHEEVLSTYYGCGLVIPDCLENCNVLDLGCGSGRDVYMVSKLVGKNGLSIGVDMTKEQLEIANKHIDYHTQKFGYDSPNVKIIEGYIEELDKLDSLIPNSLDVIISNCVVNLSNNKESVLKNAYNLLKDGGELYFSDVYSDRRIPESLRNDKVLWGECLSGALYVNDFMTLAKYCGFTDPRMVAINRITVQNKDLEKQLGNIKFYSITYRLFKLENKLDTECEDYGQAVVYQGTIQNHENEWNLDDHHKFETGKIVSVCRNTYNMLACSRFAPHFQFFGTEDTHYGIFPGCGGNLPFDKVEKNNNSKGCC